MRLINADAIRYTDLNADMPQSKVRVWVTFKEWIDAMPTIEERKTGKWIYVSTEPDGNAFYYCSECGKGEVHVPIVEVKYCWNCGARMEGGKDE